MLLTASVQGVIVGIGGLNQDPYFNNPKVGRLRHLYVESGWRKRGVGRLLVTQLIHAAKQYYQSVPYTIASHLHWMDLDRCSAEAISKGKMRK